MQAQIAELTRRIAELESNLGPPKTPDNSSVPPAQGRKVNRAERRAAKEAQGPSRRIPGAGRQSGPDR
jgi:transposase